MAAMVRRLARAMVKRAGDGDLETLSALTAMKDAMDDATGDAARALKAAGYSWTDIAREAGTSRQNARQRWSE